MRMFDCGFTDVVGKKDLRKKSRNHDNRLSKREFRDLVYKVVENMAGGNEHFDYFIDFLFNSVEVNMSKLITVVYREDFHTSSSSQSESAVNSS